MKMENKSVVARDWGCDAGELLYSAMVTLGVCKA
jgi:hypothetical protein